MSTKLGLGSDELRKRFYSLHTFEDLALLLDVPKSTLYYYAFKADPSKHYKHFDIPKRDGGKRRISAPSSPLKIIQRKLKQVLEAVYVPKASVHGFVLQRSILTNAARHGTKGRKFVFNADLKDFFPSITERRIRGLFRSKPYNRTRQLAKAIAAICCCDGRLPQGAPTSPVVSNMLCGKMDTQLRRLAQSARCVYTRYADDLTFSTTLPSFPSSIAKIDETTGTLVVADDLNLIVTLNGFQINPGKVRLQTRYKRQEITGLTVNEFPNVRRKYVRQIRAMLHALEIYGLPDAQREFSAKYARGNSAASYIKVLRGKIAFLRMVRGDSNLSYLTFSNKLDLLDPNYRKPKPKTTLVPSTGVYIVTEGKSDWKHLKAAINRFQAMGEFTDLDIAFKEYEDDPPMGDAELLRLTNGLITEAADRINVNLFDADNGDVTRKISTEHGSNYKKWTDRLFTFAIPKPSMRTSPEVSLELYYPDRDIKRTDTSGRRLFLTSEFDAKSQRHLSQNLNCTDRNRFKSGRLAIIDKDVYDERSVNIALPKDDFAKYVLREADGFSDLDISEFRLVFRMIRKIAKENRLLTHTNSPVDRSEVATRNVATWAMRWIGRHFTG